MANNTNIGALALNDVTAVKKFYNNYYDQEWTVPGDINDAIISYFESVTGSTESAKVMASGIIFTSVTQGIDPMETLHQFMSLPKGQLNSYLALFLNVNRIKTSLLGVTNEPAPNKYVKRCVLA